MKKFNSGKRIVSVLLVLLMFISVCTLSFADGRVEESFLTNADLENVTYDDLSTVGVELNKYLSKHPNASMEQINKKAASIIKSISKRKATGSSIGTRSFYKDGPNLQEVGLIALYPAVAARVFWAADAAVEESIGRGYKNESLNDGNGDAFRHCYWNVLMVKYIKEMSASVTIGYAVTMTEKFATAHEYGKSGNPVTMDLSNNSYGRNLAKLLYNGSFYSDSGLANTVQSHVNIGKLITIANGQFLPTDSSRLY